MIADPIRKAPPKRPFSLYVTEEERRAILDVAERRGVSGSAAVKFLCMKGLDWWRELTADQREIA